MKKIPFILGLIAGLISCANILGVSSQGSQGITINIGLFTEINCIQSSISFPPASAALDLQISSITGSEKIIRQIKSGINTYSTQAFSVAVSFEPIENSRLLSWDKDDRLYITNHELKDRILWNGYSGASDKILIEQGGQGNQTYPYHLTFVRTTTPYPGTLEGKITFTVISQN